MKNNNQVKVLLLTSKCNASRTESNEPFHLQMKIQSNQFFNYSSSLL